MLRRALWLALVALSGTLVLGQAPAPGPTFEVASIKPNPSRNASMSVERGGRYRAIATPLRFYIRQAYQLPNQRLVGGEQWMNRENYDIVAKMENAYIDAAGLTPPAAMRQALAALLADRFRLVVHWETRELPTYTLVLARQNGRLGPQLQRTSRDCVSESGLVAFEATNSGDQLPQARCRARASATSLSGETSMNTLATVLSSLVQRWVVNGTGLEGIFQVDLNWRREPVQATTDGVTPLPTVSTTPSAVMVALEEQLGLKLESTKGPVDVLVIDSAERPTPD